MMLDAISTTFDLPLDQPWYMLSPHAATVGAVW